MTSYVYNPSKKITELLSQYLEFDPEQLKLGIWSGNLSLKEVHLREEAIYPLLNRHLKDGGRSNRATAAGPADQQNYAKPPLRFKLVSGKIGSLSVKIPWKRLVWGNGDVQIDVRDVTIVLALESREETEQRMNVGQESAHMQSFAPEEDQAFEAERSVDNAGTKRMGKNRRKKQLVLQAAERRNLAGKSIGPWLRAIIMKEEEELAKSRKVTAEATKTLKEKESHILKWLRSTTSDFLWRFCVGLQMNVENLKVLFVQDDIEVGLVMPSNKVIPGKPGHRKLSSNIIKGESEKDASSGENEGPFAPPQNIVYDGEDEEDSEHVDKKMKSVGIGVFVRKIYHHHFIIGNQLEKVPVSVSSSDYVLRPVDVEFNFSLLFPPPIDKRKGKANKQSTIHEDAQESMSEVTGAIASESESTSKRRRGKREKQKIPPTTDTTAAMTETSTIARSHGQIAPQPRHRRANTVSTTFPNLTPSKVRRMSSTGSKHVSASKAGSFKRSYITGFDRHEQSSSVALPLAQPDDIIAVYATTTRESAGTSARLKGDLSFGAVNMVCSTRHYHLINALLAAGSKMRNGRPRTSIHSVLGYGNSNDEEIGDTSVPEEQLGNSAALEEARAEKTQVVRMWWRYVFGVLFWELRQRKRLRRVFQQKFLSFSWKRQQYKRREYVTLYIALRLRGKGDQVMPDLVSDSPQSPEEQLLAIEDELSVEQILLYRSLARAAHIRGRTDMPSSIIEMKEENGPLVENPLLPKLSGVDQEKPAASPGERGAPDDGSVIEDFGNFLSLLEARCEIARERHKSDHEALPTYQPIDKRTLAVDHGGGIDEISFSLASESRSGKTSKGGKSAASVASSVLETMSSHESASVGMLFEFTVNVQKLELVLVEEENALSALLENNSSFGSGNFSPHSEEGAPVAVPGGSPSEGCHFSQTSDPASDLSALTDDARFLREPEDLMADRVEESESVGPILTSEDFLLFRGAEKVILQFVLSPLAFSELGQIGGSINLNFSIGTIIVSGEQGVELLEIGFGATEAPVHEVDISRQTGGFPSTSLNVPDEALSLSFVDKSSYSFLQCDASTIRGKILPTAISKVLAFPSSGSVFFPRPLLRRSAREEVRLYILQQNETPFATWKCSIRVHGCKILLPVEPQDKMANSDGNGSALHNSSCKGGEGDDAVVFRCRIVEVYSGSAVEELSAGMESSQTNVDYRPNLSTMDQPNIQTRQLRMLDVPELMLANRSSLSSHWVAAASGLEICSNSQNLFREPLDIEMFYTGNADSLLDYNRAKKEIVVEVSPVHILVSEDRIRFLSRINPYTFTRNLNDTDREDEECERLPPRLEALSKFMRYSLDFSISRVRISFFVEDHEEVARSLLSKQLAMEDCMNDFLGLVSRFDLSFPHEEALSAAMQICIDRLAGSGLPLEESWEAANLVLLNFLEDMAETRRGNTEGFSPISGSRTLPLDEDHEVVLQTIEKSVQRTVVLYTDRLTMGAPETCMVDDVVIDLPDGVVLANISCFYDYHMSIGIPSVFVANGSGIHVIRITAPENTPSGRTRNQNEIPASDQRESSVGTGGTNRHRPFCIALQRFALDRGCRFGKGGLPLAILGTDERVDDSANRVREQLEDLELGDIELLFSRRLYQDIFTSLFRIFSALNDIGSSPRTRVDAKQSTTVDSYRIVTATSASALFVSDELLPFSRFTLMNLLGRAASTECDEQESSRTPSGHLSVRSLGLLNLTPEGELFPEVISVLPGQSGPSFFISFHPNRNLHLDMKMQGVRIIFLKQYLNEFLQYFVSGDYGVAALLRFLRDKSPPKSSKSGRPFQFRISFLASSFILPRSSSSFDMLCIEVEETTIESSHVTSSFSLPAEGRPLSLGSEVVYGESSLGTAGATFDSISRKSISIKGFRVFSSLPERIPDSEDQTPDSPSFRFFYILDGRAEAGKQVYRPIVGPDSVVDNIDLETNDERAKRVWLEVTVEKSSLDLVIDYAPHMRILILDPSESDSTEGGLELDMRLSQFCLLLSIWFSNMQELPLMFPYSAVQLQDGARALHHNFKFPEYGSEAFRSLLKTAKTFTSEIGIAVNRLSLRCTFDKDHLDASGSESNAPGICLGFEDAVVHVTNDGHGVSRIGSGSSKSFLIDESLCYADVLEVGDGAAPFGSWADLQFGLKRNRHSLVEPLAQAFQLSIFMTPSWTIYNLGLEAPHIVLSDLWPVFRFLEFVSAYSSDARFGHPSFQALERAQRIKERLRGSSVDKNASSLSGSGLDFRLWLGNPSLTIPCDPSDKSCPGVRVMGDGGGLWYKYSFFDALTSHECVSESLRLVFDEQTAGNNEEAGRTLIERLSFGLRYDTNSSSNHTDISLQIPFVDKNACGLTSPRITVSPTVLSPPTICTPIERPNRNLGPSVCEMTCIIELLPLTSAALVNFFDASSASDPKSKEMEHAPTNMEDRISADIVPETVVSTALESSKQNGGISFVASVGDFRIFALDPILGPHLPVAVVSVSHLSMTASRFPLETMIQSFSDCAPPEDLQFSMAGHVWADYFKLGLTRSWEPLVEAYQFSALFEKSRSRGSGLTMISDNDFHINISSALLVILDEVIDVFKRLIQETFSSDPSVRGEESEEARRTADHLSLADSICGRSIFHEMPKLVEKGDRVAFSMRNMTGQKMRFYGAHPQGLHLTYLGHEEATKLSFSPSISLVKNLRVKEVAYPGLPTGFQWCHHDVPAPTVDVQPVGFEWVNGIAVDTFGRTFASLVPRSTVIQAKLAEDWSLANALNLLVEVGLENGGRQVTFRSIFSVVNKTNHDIGLLFNPDPLSKPHGADHSQHPTRNGGTTDDEAIEEEKVQGNKGGQWDHKIEPGATIQVPSLLFESALRQPGHQLGLMWMKPEENARDTVASFFAENQETASSLEVDFCSRPVQFASIVQETSSMFAATNGRTLGSEDAKSGIQVSCPVVHTTGSMLAPFCYVLEVGRSPVVAACSDSGDSITASPVNEKGAVHRPVAYTLSLHPPLIIANLLPEKGRFELMHAVHQTVLWFGDLEPGQELAVHSVGLDSPLILLVNVGFAKTPVGEGALVHHGTDPPPGARENLGLKSIGRAGKAVTKQLGNIIAMSDTPNKRGQRKMFLAQNPHIAHDTKYKGRANKAKAKIDLDTGTDNDRGKTYKINTSRFFPNDVVDEMCIVDSLAQRLTLNIENSRGGGGQRRIAVFCRFWILNTTEHCLRYKQEGSKPFVSGTVLSPVKNGSLPLTGGRAHAKYEAQELPNPSPSQPLTKGTIFPGTPGALASYPGQCDLPPDVVASLIDKDMPLDTIARLAFMFNFHEGAMVAAGNQKLCVQLADGTGMTNYESDFSRGFSLDTIGIPQVVSLHCKDGRALELVAVVLVAPGFLSRYTKIIRFLPRYIAVNTLPYPIRLWQDNSIFRPLSADSTGTRDGTGTSKWRFSKEKERRNESKVNQYEALWGRETVLEESGKRGIPSGTAAHGSALYIATIMPSEIIPFSLPDSRGERQLRFDLGQPWNLTASVSADMPGDHVIKMRKAVDLRIIPHVSTRSNPRYEVRLPPSGGAIFDGELGIWFETEWGASRSLIVKAVKKNSFAFNETDVHVGDELLAINGAPVSCMTFSEAMNMLRSRIMDCSTVSQKDSVRSADHRLGILRPRSVREHKNENSNEVKSCVLIFRTVEERLRRVRMKAAKASGSQQLSRASSMSTRQSNLRCSSFQTPDPNLDTDLFIQAELKPLRQSDLGTFVLLRGDPFVPFQIQNRSVHSTIYYRQRGCNQHAWHSLKPGQTNSYSWEEPLKPKRLSVRVASDDAFQYSESFSSEDVVENTRNKSAGAESSMKGRRWPFRKVKGEEESAFSQSATVRLEEIGFQDILSVDSDETSATKRLKMEVYVEGLTRVLNVFDETVDSNENQMECHLVSLRKMARSEESRLEQLKMLKVFVSPSPAGALLNEADNKKAAKSAMDLMNNFPNSATITQCHQIVVEVLEAVGLNTDSFVGSCNPYAEICLKTAGRRRKFIFKRKDTRRTYYVRKSVNPTWNSQSFVFNVPEEAVSVTRGHSIEVCLRNFRALGNHNTLGRAHVDLHSVRNQEPLVGWFPLVGRTGRRELENQLSHWGRGSVKLKVQWIYSLPALMQYFILLSANRLSELRISGEGMAELLRKEKEIQNKKISERDGFSSSRVEDMLALSRVNMKERKAQIQKLKKLNKSTVRKSSDATKTRAEKRNIRKPKEISRIETAKRFENLNDDAKSLPLFLPSGNDLRRKRLNSSDGFVQNLEEKISRQRRSFDRLSKVRARFERKPSVDVDSGIFDVPSFRFWSWAQAIFNDNEFNTELKGDSIKITLRPSRPRWSMREAIETNEPEHQTAVSRNLKLSPRAPALIRNSVAEYISDFCRSRTSFERVASMSLTTVLHGGGWLTIRPITALNLPEIYSGMFVKVRYGSEVLQSETVDARVFPTWYKPEAMVGNGDGMILSSTDPTAEEEMEALCSNDLHIHVAPQKTSGSIRLSVIGERSQTQLHARTEVGLVDLPLGASIAACIDCSNSRVSTQDKVESGSIFADRYVRWFPLMSPKDALQVEGDEGRSTRPPDTEKTNDDMFHDYFAPCIKLALSWSPDEEKGTTAKEATRKSPPHPSITSAPSHSVVKNYVNADIGRISVALIDSQRSCELLSLSIQDIDLRYWTTSSKTRVGMTVGWIQLDFQDSEREPVVLAPTPTDFHVPVLQSMAVKDNNRSGSDIISLDFIDVSLAEFDLTIEENIILDISDFFDSIRTRKGVRLQARVGVESEGRSTMQCASLMEAVPSDRSHPSMRSLLELNFSASTKRQSKVYIKQLFLGVVKVNLSYLRGKTLSEGRGEKNLGGQVLNFAGGEYLLEPLSLVKDGPDIYQLWQRHTFAEDRHAEEGKGFHNSATLFASLFPTVSDAPVRLPGKALTHVFEWPSDILQNIGKFYVTETLKQIYKIVGSLDFVGNPTMLVSSFASGVRDLFVVPSKAILKSPTDPSRVGLGMAKGTLSLVSHSASGFFGVLAKVSARAGQGVAFLSCDHDFSVWHRNKVVVEATNLNRDWKRRGVQKVEQMLSRPIVDLILGITWGISGVIISPVKGYQQKRSLLGVVQGVAVGGIGLIAKPAVGVLDAFTHFSSSIHDIAKSVNVLDKRLQPAIKLRMPYTFGMKSILSPYDPVFARADYLLKGFPMKISSPPFASDETIVHTEVLPSIGNETFAIATTARVILLKVKKDPTGILTASRCWEVIFSEDSTTSSKLMDHGHNGVAMTLLQRRHDSTNRPDFADAGSPGTSEPQLGARMSVSTFQAEGPDQRVLPDPVDTSEFDHGLERDAEGGALLEWYKVIAEYQYRSQLTRLHNAISCMQGNLDAIIRDPSLGRTGSSSEGYTSFGMFYFEAENVSNDEEEDVELRKQLEGLPWVSKSTFVAGQKKSASEQKTYLAHLRENWTFEDELEASRQESGSDWLIVARAEACFVESTVQALNSGSSEEAPTVQACDDLISALDLAEPTLFPSVEDDDKFSDENLPDKTRMQRQSLNHYMSALQLETWQDTSENSTDESSSPSRKRDQMPSALLGFLSSPHKMRRRNTRRQSHDSKGTLQSFQSATDRRWSSTSGSTTFGLDDSRRIVLGMPTESSTHQPQKPLSVTTQAWQTPEPRESISNGQSQTPSQPPPPLEQAPTEFPPQDPRASHRIDRMERLLERLLIFTGEQALAMSQQQPPSASQANLDEVASLRQEIAELRRNIQIQQSEIVSPVEVACLRNEIASLRAQLGLPTTRSSEGPPPTIEQID